MSKITITGLLKMKQHAGQEITASLNRRSISGKQGK